MSTAAASTDAHIDLATWDADVSQRDDSFELVEGVPTMAPGEGLPNRLAVTLLAGLLNRSRGEWAAATDVGLTISDVPATVRYADVVAFALCNMRDAAEGGADLRLPGHDALFVAEVVSPTSIERDLVTKRREYALAGIPSYLVVDLRDGRRNLYYYRDRDERSLFRDVTPTDHVTLTVDDTAVPVRVDDLLA